MRIVLRFIGRLLGFIVRLLGFIGRLLGRGVRYEKEKRALGRAARYGLTEEYKEARRRGMGVEDALAEWDLGELEEG